MRASSTRPPLWFVRAAAAGPVIVADLREAVRLAEHRIGDLPGCQHAGRRWWLVPAWTAAAALLEASHLGQRRHAMQPEFDAIHQAIRCGLDPDISPLFDLRANAHRRRDYPLITTPL